jgi:hypothetical protein
MNVQVLRGSKQEIAEGVARIPGEVREAIVFIEGPADAPPRPGEDIFAEMDPFVANAGGADYSRDTLYSRLEGE